MINQLLACFLQGQPLLKRLLCFWSASSVCLKSYMQNEFLAHKRKHKCGCPPRLHKTQMKASLCLCVCVLCNQFIWPWHLYESLNMKWRCPLQACKSSTLLRAFGVDTAARLTSSYIRPANQHTSKLKARSCTVNPLARCPIC